LIFTGKIIFIFGSATFDEWFTDRENDTTRLLTNFKNGINTIIISPRRWGKTSLVLKTANLANSKDLKVVNMDIFSCRSEEDFYQLFAVEIIKQTSSKWEEWVQNAKQFLTSLTPKITFGIDPINDFSISLDFSNKQLNEDVLSLPQKIASEKNIKIVVCIDEFQQISEFNQSVAFQKKLRSVWQLQKQVSYCLYGSKKHLMSELFSKQSLPFYRFGDIIFLQKIETSDWVQYIQNRFSHTHKSISANLAERICQTVDNHSSYVQQFAWLIWTRTEQNVTETNFEEALNDLLNQNSILYYNYMEGLTALQINFLHAIADGIHHEFSQKEVMNKYNLGTSANISRVKKSLEQKELIDIYPKKITINDPVFRLWLKKSDYKILNASRY
jgi:hypothetical protein